MTYLLTLRHGFSTVQLAALVACSIGLVACGQGDERPASDRLEPLDHAGPPPDGCDAPEASMLGLDEETVFGESGLDMLAAVLPAGATIPFFWVGYDGLDGPVSYLPGVSETELRLSLEPREGAMVRQSVAPLTESLCEPSRVEIPVRVALETLDGALAETFEADVSFEQRDVASLGVELAPEAIRGSLALEPTGALAAGWQLIELGIQLSLWRGGTSGAITPSFVKAGPATPPLRTGPEAVARASEGLGDGPGIPLHWSSLAVWPRRERCAEGPAIDADERRFGWSPRDAVAALAERAALAIVTEAGRTPVRASFVEPSGLVCMGPGDDNGHSSFTVPGWVRADASASGSPLENVELNGTFRVSAKSAVDGSGISEIIWQRSMPDFTSIVENRESFASSTSLVVDAPDHHQLFWWTLTAEQYRVAPGDPWLGDGELVVLGADGFTETSVRTGAPQGQTPPPAMTFQTLEGDELLRARITP